MPTIVIESFEVPPPLIPPRKRWTREDCVPLEEAGLFEREKLELVDGELISKMGKNRPQVNALTAMLFWLSEAFGKQFINPEAPIDVSPSDNSRNEPEPDLIVLKRPSTNFASGNPKPEDVALLVEIADSSLRFDLTVKAVLYARAGIADYWVLDVVAQQLYCHREPDGVRYQSVVVYGEGETVCPLAKPEAEFRVGIAFER